jgi:hypothetical protein
VSTVGCGQARRAPWTVCAAQDTPITVGLAFLGALHGLMAETQSLHTHLKCGVLRSSGL